MEIVGVLLMFFWVVGYLFTLGCISADSHRCTIDVIVAIPIWPYYLGFLWADKV